MMTVQPIGAANSAVYPEALIERLRNAHRHTLRLEGQPTHLLADRADNSTPALQDFCRILTFSYDGTQNRGAIDAVLSTTGASKDNANKRPPCGFGA